MVSLLGSNKALRTSNLSGVSIGEKLQEMELQRNDRELIQTDQGAHDWSGDILGLVDTNEYVDDVKSSLEE